MSNLHKQIVLSPVSDWEKKRAALTVVEKAHDRDEARLFLQMLDLADGLS